MAWTLSSYCLSHTLFCPTLNSLGGIWERLGGLGRDTELGCFVKGEKEGKEIVMTLCPAPPGPPFF